MTFITLTRLAVFAPAPLFQNVSLTLGPGERLAVVAANGAGKSTLLRCIAGLTEASLGSVDLTRGLTVGFVQQTVPDVARDLTFAQLLASVFAAHERDANIWRAELLFDEFKVPMGLRSRCLSELSGGWQRLAILAQAFLTEPDVLLLDEPTNHLDVEKITLLERWIHDKASMMPMVIASHDRRFLDRCTTHSLFLRPDVSRLYDHPYSRARKLLAADDAAQAAKFSRDLKEADRLKKSAKALYNIGVNSGSDAAQKKSKQLGQRASDIEKLLTPVAKDRGYEIRLHSQTTHAKVLITMNDVAVRRPDGLALFRTGKLSLFVGDRVVISGPNGAGKSCFVHLLRDILEGRLTNAEIKASPSLVLGYADQHMSQLFDTETPFEHVARFRLGDQRARTLLAGAGFPVQQQARPLKQFSSGQKARLGMLVLRLTAPNFYLLDEPTNHVDIQGQENLEAEILTQEATCLIVSHDRAFVANVGTRFLRIENKRLVETERP